jgi:D-alanyl-D-alanine carboxypeptidase
MRHELVDLTSMLVQECKNRGYRFGTPSDPSYGCWGYSCRAISGSNNPSNHSWGLAVDINAPSNPYTSPLVTDMPSWMPDLWNEYGFRWGGDYSGSKDAMHYEFMESVSAAADYTARAKAAGLGGGGVQPPEPPKPEPDDEEDYMYYNVVRDKAGVDYAYCGPTGVFFRIDTEDQYWFLQSASMVKIPHGQAPVIEQNLLDFIKDECSKRVGNRQPAILAQGGGQQSIDEALAQTRNDVSAIKANLGA